MNTATAASAVEATLVDLSTVPLSRVLETAALQTRMDRKYLLPPHVFETLVEGLRETCDVLQINGLRTFAYESVYFDTPDLESFRRAATGRRRRFKVRTRSYLDSGDTVLEVKTEGGRSQTVKERFELPLTDRDRLEGAAREFVAARIDVPVGRLRPVLTTAYRRATLVARDGSFRMTCDTDLRLSDPSGRSSTMDHLVLVETKSGRGTSASDRLLWRLGHRPTPVSKYAVGLALLHPRLRANRWSRTLRRHFGWRPDPRPDPGAG